MSYGIRVTRDSPQQSIHEAKHTRKEYTAGFVPLRWLDRANIRVECGAQSSIEMVRLLPHGQIIVKGIES